MRRREAHNSKGITKNREVFIRRTATDTVVSFKLEGISITFEEAYEMAKQAASKAEKEGRLVLA